MRKGVVSNRLLKVPQSPIRGLVPYAIAAKKKGVKVYHLNIGDPDLDTPAEMIDVLKNWKINPIRYGQSQGEPEFLKAMETYYSKIGYPFVKTENIQATSGGSEAISFAFFSICEPGEEIIVFEPLYTNYNSYASINQVKLVPILTYGKTGFHLPDKSAIEKKITKKTRGILLCNPSNPTGTIYSKKEIEILVGLVKKHNLYLIVDEVYREFVYDGVKHVSILNYMNKMPEQTILLDSLSKRYNLCGARLGVLVSLNKEVMDGVLRIAQGRLSAGFVDQNIGAKLVDIKPSYFKAVNQEYKNRRDVLYQGLKKIRGVFLEKPEGAFYTVVKLPVKDSEKFCKWLLTTFRYKNETVMLAPAEGFYATPGLGKDEVRIAYVLNVESIKKAIEILRRALIEYKG